MRLAEGVRFSKVVGMKKKLSIAAGVWICAVAAWMPPVAYGQDYSYRHEDIGQGYGREEPLRSRGSFSGTQFHEQTELLTPAGIVDESKVEAARLSQLEPAAGGVDDGMPAIPVLDDVPVDEVESAIDPAQSYPDTAEPLTAEDETPQPVESAAAEGLMEKTGLPGSAILSPTFNTLRPRFQ